MLVFHKAFFFFPPERPWTEERLISKYYRLSVQYIKISDFLLCSVTSYEDVYLVITYSLYTVRKQ